MYSALSGPTDWILRYIKTTFTFTLPTAGKDAQTPNADMESNRL